MFVSLESCKKLPAHLYLINQCHSDKKVKTAYKRIQTRSMERWRAIFCSVGFRINVFFEEEKYQI